MNQWKVDQTLKSVILFKSFLQGKKVAIFLTAPKQTSAWLLPSLKSRWGFNMDSRWWTFFPIKLEPRHMGGSRGRLITIPASLSDYWRRFSRSVDLGNKIKWEWIIILKPKNRCFHIVHDTFSHDWWIASTSKSFLTSFKWRFFNE